MDFRKYYFRRTLCSKIEASVALGKIKAAIVYLNFIKGARCMTMLACVLVLCAVILACGFLLIPVGLSLFMPWAPETKAIVAVSFTGVYHHTSDRGDRALLGKTLDEDVIGRQAGEKRAQKKDMRPSSLSSSCRRHLELPGSIRAPECRIFLLSF